MNKTIGILAHVDAGKTTFAEQLLFLTQSIRHKGRVDHKDTFFDTHEIEKERGITVFADQAVMHYNGSTYHLIDTPGHIDFSPEMERAIQVMDYAIVIISAVEGVEAHTETVWQLLHKHKVPTFFFINKTDRTGADVQLVLEEIRTNVTDQVIDITGVLERDRMQESLVESIALMDESLLERYMEGNYDFGVWLGAMRTMMKQHVLFPCLHGSALQGTGMGGFIDHLDQLTITNYTEHAEFAGRVYKIRHDTHGTRITYIKALSGSLEVRDEIGYGSGQQRITEKVTQIRIYNGSKFTTADRVCAGQLFAVTGLSAASAGDGVGTMQEQAGYDMVPALESKVIHDASKHPKDVLKDFNILHAEDPSLNVTWDEPLQEIRIHVMGTIQLEVLEQLVRTRFGYAVSFGKPEVLYKETISTPVEGCGHFEPLGHYAEVHLKLEPAERDSGITFVNACHADDLATGYQNLIQQHLYERDHHGILTGSPVTDLRVTLLTGRSHNKHTSGGDFREAAYRALRQGLEKAANHVLEPYYDFKINVQLDHMGRVLSDIQKACGTFIPPQSTGSQVMITGRAPVATFIHYSTELAAFTQGKGRIRLVVGGYDVCHNEEEVIVRKGYQKNADPQYTSSSIFCSKGQAYSVAWDQAEKHMHCLR